MKKKILIIIFLATCLFSFNNAKLVYAQNQGGNTGSAQLVNPLGTTSLYEMIARVINTILGLVGSIALLMFIWGGFQWLISGGNSAKVQKGKDTIMYAAVGLVIIFTSYGVVKLVISALTGK